MKFRGIFVFLISVFTLIGCGGGSDSSSGDTETKTTSVRVIDGIIANATVNDSNGLRATYKDDGTYEFSKTPNGELKATGGVFKATNLKNKMILKASAGSKVISPLTTFALAYSDKEDFLKQSLQVQDLNVDFIKTNAKNLAKMAQILYILEVNNLSAKFNEKLLAQTTLSDLAQKAKDSVSESSFSTDKKTKITSFIEAVENLDDNVNTSDYETKLKEKKTQAQAPDTGDGNTGGGNTGGGNTGGGNTGGGNTGGGNTGGGNTGGGNTGGGNNGGGNTGGGNTGGGNTGGGSPNGIGSPDSTGFDGTTPPKATFDIDSMVFTPSRFGIDTDSNIVINFTKAVDRSTVDGNLSIIDSPYSRPYTVTYSNGDKTLTLNPDSNFNYDDSYYIKFQSGLKDVDGNAFKDLNGTYWFASFRTKENATAPVDTTKPEVRRIRVSNSSGGIDANNGDTLNNIKTFPIFSIGFSEPVTKESFNGKFSIKEKMTGMAFTNLKYNEWDGSGDVDIFGILEISAKSPLKFNTTYVVNLKKDGIKDTAGNEMEAGNFTFEFTTKAKEYVKPTITSAKVSRYGGIDGSDAIDLNDSSKRFFTNEYLGVQFSENLIITQAMCNKNNYELKETTSGTKVDIADYGYFLNTKCSNSLGAEYAHWRRLTFGLKGLKYDTDYTLTFKSDTFKDTSGNIMDEKSYNFKTKVKPTEIGFSIVNNESGHTSGTFGYYYINLRFVQYVSNVEPFDDTKFEIRRKSDNVLTTAKVTRLNSGERLRNHIHINEGNLVLNEEYKLIVKEGAFKSIGIDETIPVKGEADFTFRN